MSKQEEIKQALAALKLGHWHKADFDAKAPEYIAYLLACVEGLEASKEIEIENHAQSCFDYQDQIQVLKDERDRLRKELEEKDAALAVWARKEIEWHENVEGLRDLLHKISDAEWEESMDSHFNDVFTTRTINPAQIANEALDFVGQEGEGNQEEMRHLTPEESEAYERSLDKLFNQSDK
ncbi:hypothetical protein BK131_04405 [Paenibacillus amylolyticus]|uniref:Uncharacterized protein n=1 Tax=Paenibacillus amylolyticus TaxID=1451 RepID=A0A1R1C510_PAEAM|nr:hypothetical protein [Paenibacillus amylolyticus]OMF17212.1 hypothetical protein BK131_04405 [Paenibacillus amylolyticus]